MDALELKPENRLLRSAPTQSPKRPYPLNCWWVAATKEEVTRKPISRWLLEQRVVLYRTGDGVVVALADRCAHRWAPLSQGRLIGDEIACPYHGFRYNTRGACTHVPTQSHIPAALKVRSYPVREHGPFVWIWMGDSTRADAALLPDIFWSTAPTYIQLSGYMEVSCNYIAVQENISDTAHADYLHSPANRDWLQPAFSLAPEDVQVTDRSVTTVVKCLDLPYQGPLESIGTDEEKRVNLFGRGTFTAPACSFLETNIEHLAPAPELRRRYTQFGLHCTTPISPIRCHWWWAYIQNFGHGISQHFQEQWEVILKQDKDVVEAIQMTTEQDVRGENAPEVLVKADRALSAVRRTLRKMLEADSQYW